MKKVYGKQPKLELGSGTRKLLGGVSDDNKMLSIVIMESSGNITFSTSFIITSLSDVSKFRDFVRQAERHMKASIKK